MDTILFCQLDLLIHNLVNTEVVKPQIGWQTGLIVSYIVWTSFRNVGPLCESPSPPTVVLRNGMILRQIKRNYSYIVQLVYFRLPLLTKCLLIADYRAHLEGSTHVVKCGA